VGRMLRFGGHRSRVLGVVHLHEILEHSLRLVQPQLEAKFIEVDTSFQADSDLIEGDEHELQQAFVNLLLNAFEALPPNGSLKATTSLLEPPVSGSATRQLRLTLQDSGPGIPPENLDRLFEPFFTTKPEGTGLGLAITQRIVQEHRGEITVKSQPKLGTTFVILLPAARPPAPSAKSTSLAKDKPAQATPLPASHRRT
jgi:signal transduction histidine kinase